MLKDMWQKVMAGSVLDLAGLFCFVFTTNGTVHLIVPILPAWSSGWGKLYLVKALARMAADTTVFRDRVFL